MTKKNPTSGIYLDAGLGKASQKRYQKRRMALAKKIGHLSIIFGLENGPGGQNPWTYLDTRIYQEPLLIYLTGINQLNTILLLDPKSKKSKEILFLSPKNPNLEFWEGIRFGTGTNEDLEFIRKITGIKEIYPIDQWEAVLTKKIKAYGKNSKLGLLWHEKLTEPPKIIKDSNFEAKEKILNLFEKNKWNKNQIANIAKTQWELRLPLDATDIKNTRIANIKTANAFKSLLQNIHLMKNEAQVRGFLDGCMQMQSSYGLSFPTIAASGENATVLHYTKNDDPFHKDDLILMDFGTRWYSMHADISRTFPVNGIFNPLQKILYQIALEANLLVEKSAKAGLTIKTLNEICWGFIEQELKNRFIDAGGKMSLRYKKNPHGVSHLMGEQEHDGDPFGEYKNEPMQPGWLISNEPGIYGDFKIKLNGKTYDQAIGIRVEDNLLIQNKHCKNLSTGCPKTIKDLESIMAFGKKKNNLVTI